MESKADCRHGPDCFTAQIRFSIVSKSSTAAINSIHAQQPPISKLEPLFFLQSTCPPSNSGQKARKKTARVNQNSGPQSVCFHLSQPERQQNCGSRKFQRDRHVSRRCAGQHPKSASQRPAGNPTEEVPPLRSLQLKPHLGWSMKSLRPCADLARKPNCK